MIKHRPYRYLICGIVAALAAAIVSTTAWSAETHNVEITAFTFKPEKLTVNPGDTIVWTNRDIVPHTATANDGGWDTGEILQNQSKSITLDKKYDLSYFCRFHPAMKALLTLFP